ncbi:MAG: hypothetical protein Q4F99_02790 [bacterium]|nr:hypothetical protein [bacterium]
MKRFITLMAAFCGLSSFVASPAFATDATCVAQIGETKYASLQEAINAATEGQTVQLIADVVLTETVTVAADDEITLDLNGKTVSMQDASGTGAYLLKNYGDLIIKDSATDGKLTFMSTTPSANNGYSTSTIGNAGDLTIESGTIESTTTSGASYAIDTLWYSSDISLTIAGGTINAAKNAIRQVLYSTTAKNVLNVTGGKITGGYAALQTFNATGNACLGSVNISGGTLQGTYAYYTSYTRGESAHAGTDVEIAGGTFTGKVYVYNSNAGASETEFANVAISGGTFNDVVRVYTKDAEGNTVQIGAISGGTHYVAIEEGSCALGFIPVDNGDGTYGVKDDPTTHYISNLDELKAFRDSVNSGTTYKDVTVYLAADIDLASIETWVGIGSINADHGFMGNFNGNGHKILNLTIKNPALVGGYAYAGLFSITEGTDEDNQNIIKNLIIENVTIETTGQIAAAAIAYPYYTIVENVEVCGDINIKGGDYTAGVLAYTRRCTDAKDLTISGNTGSVIEGKKTVGGVISDIQMNGGLTADYSNFNASGLTIKGDMHVGGISGIISAQELDGCSVSNVVLQCSDARVGIVSGSLGGASTITNATIENVTGATAVIGGTYSDGAAVQARIGDKYYATLQAAYDAAAEGDTITLLADATGKGLVIDKAITIDFKGHTYTVNHAVGSSSTQTLGMQINAATILTSSVEAKGKLTCLPCDLSYTEATPEAVAGCGYTSEKPVRMLINNYANLTITNVILDGTNLAPNKNGAAHYVLSNNSGNVVIDTGAEIKAAEGDFAFDVCKYGNYEVPTVTLNTTGTITGDVEVSGGDFIRTAGTITGKVVLSAGSVTGIVPTAAAGKALVNTNGVYTVVDAVAEVNGVTYATLQDAYDNATAGATITLLADTEAPGIKIKKSIVLDLAGKTLTLTPPAVGSTGTETLGMQILKTTESITIMNGTINVAASNKTAEKPIKMLIQNYSLALTLSNVTLDGTNLVKPDNSPIYVLSNNQGTVTIGAGTTITAPEGGIAFDVCKYGKYTAPTVTVEAGATIGGTVEVDGGTLKNESETALDVTIVSGGTVTGKVDVDADTYAIKIGNVYCKWIVCDEDIDPNVAAEAAELFTGITETYVDEDGDTVADIDWDFGITKVEHDGTDFTFTAKVQKGDATAAGYAADVTVVLVDEDGNKVENTSTTISEDRRTATIEAKLADVVGKKLKAKAKK